MTPKEIEEALKKPFRPEEIEWRVQSAGQKDGKVWAMVLAYVDSRAIMNRLDEVLGIDGWKNNIREISNGSFLCELSIKVNGEWITKTDGSDQTDFEAVKGGISGAIKRAGALMGIGRYLYKLDATYAKVHDKGKNYQGGKKKDGKEVYPAFRWDAPELPAWALPDGYKTEKKPEPVKDDMLDKIDMCSTHDGLNEIWKSLSKEQKEKYKLEFTRRKNEIGGEQ